MRSLDPAAAARLRRLGGDRLLRELIELFLAHGPERLAAAGAGAADWASAERACHSLKSAAGNLGATELQGLAGEAEAVAGTRDLAAFAAAVAALPPAYAAVETELRQLLKGLEP